MNEKLHLSPRQETAILQAVQNAEAAAVEIRSLAAMLLPPRQSGTEAQTLSCTASVGLSAEGWLRISLPVMLPRRGESDHARFLEEPLRTAIRDYFADRPRPRFHDCVLVYEHIYGSSRRRRFTDHDNLELKHCQDVLEGAFLENDTAALCSAFQCSHYGESDETRIWILTPEQYPAWLEVHRKSWRGTPKNAEI